MQSTLVLGSPGTGKTYNLVEKINSFIDKGHKPEDITILSHTRVAAKEIASRCKKSGVKASTIHSLAYAIAEVSKESVITNKEIKEFSESIGVAMKGYSNETDESLELGDEFLSVINYSKAHMMPMPWAYNEKGRPGTRDGFEHFYENYTNWKTVYGFVDFNDMLELAILVEADHNYPVLLVDEAQDLSKSQWELIEKISKNTVEMIVTGDPDQSLFKWGGAYPMGMIHWSTQKEASVEELRQSYRVPELPYRLSREIITRVANRYEKDYKPTDKVGEVQRYLTVNHYDFSKLKSALILYRSHALRKEVERRLIECYKPYTALNGYPGLCQNNYGKAIQAWMRIKSSEFPDKNDINIVKRIASPALLLAIKNNDLDTICNIKGEHALIIPTHLLKYYKMVDFTAIEEIQLSTIHGAKGMEHDTVILINGITQRVVDGATADPDSEYQVWYVGVTRTKNKLHIIDGEGVYNPI